MFQKYNSIENSYRDKFVDIIKSEISSDELFCVQEKIHGANFSFQINKKEPMNVKVASRNGFLEESDNFYNHKIIESRYKNNIISLFHYLQSIDINIDTLVVYGELCGGTYPHNDIDRVKGVKKVNSGIFYSPNIEFIAFDIKINGTYIDLLNVEKYCKVTEIPFDPILFQGSLDECLDFHNDFNSIIATNLFGLPKLEDNIVEGTVIKSIKPLYLKNGDRIVLKNKNSKWKEKIKRKKKKEIKLTENGQLLLDELLSLNTQNRVLNVFSKVGNITEKDFGKILGMYSKDVMEEFNKDYSLDIIEDNAEKNKIKKIFQKEAADIVREIFKKEV